jgi:hypothetical protein
MKSRLLTLIAMALTFATTAGGHGVERGTQPPIPIPEMPELAELRVRKILSQRCDLTYAVDFKATNQVDSIRIGQGIEDRVHNISIRVFYEEEIFTSRINIQVAEYQLDNPAIDSIEVLSIVSDICY